MKSNIELEKIITSLEESKANFQLNQKGFEKDAHEVLIVYKARFWCLHRVPEYIELFLLKEFDFVKLNSPIFPIELTEKTEKILKNNEKTIIPSKISINDVFVQCNKAIEMPKDVRLFFPLLRHINNVVKHDLMGPKNELLERYFRALFDVLTWFIKDFGKTLIDEKMSSKIKQLVEFHRFDHEFSKLRNRAVTETNFVDLASKIKVLEQKIRELEKENRRLSSSDNLFEIKELLMNGFKETNMNIKEVKEKIDDLMNLVQTNQIDIAAKLKLALKNNDDERFEMILADFTDKVTTELTKRIKENDVAKSYKSEEEFLKAKFTGGLWSKMEEKSQAFLTTANVLFKQLAESEQVDYSGVCILVSKAVETELQKRLYKNFSKYLNNRFDLKKEHDEWHSSLIKKNKNGEYVLIPEYEFTLGTLPFICSDKPFYVSEEVFNNNQKRIIEFAQDELFLQGIANEEIKKQLRFISDNARKLKDEFRNPSAHTNELKRNNAEDCINFVIMAEKVLIKMLNMFRQ